MLPVSLIASFVKWLVMSFVALVLCEPAFGQLGKSAHDFSEWKKQKESLIIGLGSAPEDQALPELYSQLIKFNHAYKCDETSDLLDLVVRALTSIPGYESYYKNKIDSEREQYRRTGELNESNYADAKNKIALLRYIRRPEAVAMLGYFLNDAEGRDGKTLTGYNVHSGDYSSSVNCMTAASVLSDMKIESPPFDFSKIAETEWERVDAWKDWWNEIAAGKRTYRFIGSPIEYGPNGPVEKKVTDDHSHDRAERGAPTIGQASLGKNLPESNTTSPWAKIAGGIAAFLALTGAWFAFRKRPTF